MLDEKKARGEAFVRNRWQITIPKQVRKALNVTIGQRFTVTVAGDGFLVWPLELYAVPGKASENIKGPSDITSSPGGGNGHGKI
jgi:bifunctional DNA-binding transcriptional regulator/antitoxin component of YhaV-PrlF toxin-antitoxin module